MVLASYWLIINTNGTLLPIPVHWHVCMQWDVSNTDQVATVRRTCCLIHCSGVSPNEVRATWIGRQLSDKLVACIQCSIFSANKMWAIGIGMQLPGHLVADTMCYNMPLSNQTLVTRIYGCLKIVKRWTNHHVLMLASQCFLWWLYVTQPVLGNEVSLNVFETKTVHLYWDYLVMCNVLHSRWKSYS
jgi:hypothetical protein